MSLPRLGSNSTLKLNPFPSATWRNSRSRRLRISTKVTVSRLTDMAPDSTLARSRMSLIKRSRSPPEA